MAEHSPIAQGGLRARLGGVTPRFENQGPIIP